MVTLLSILGSICTGVFILPWLMIFFWAVKQDLWRQDERAIRDSQRLQALLPEWAKKEGYSVLFRERLQFWSTPFIPNNRRVDYRIIVEDAQGQSRRGWVRFGGWPRGIYSTRAKVIWEQPQPARRASSNRLNDLRDDPLWDDWLDHRADPRR
jgi:hypothetical protein